MWRLGGLNSGSSGLGLSPLHGHRVVFFKETLNLTLTVPLFNQVYKITKLIRGSEHLGATDMPIVDKQGRLLTMEAEQEERWAEYFSEVLKQKYRFLILT